MMTRRVLYAALGALMMAGAVGMAWQSPFSSGPEHYQAWDPSQSEEPVPEFSKGIRGALQFYHYTRHNLYTGNVPLGAKQEVLEQVRKLERNTPRAKNSDALQWNFLGPDNFGGRTRDMIIDQDDNELLVVGSVGGGVFRSTDRGKNWTPVPNTAVQHLAITCMEQTGNGVMYYGTGEQNFTRLVNEGGVGGSGVLGQGVWKSEDKGQNWEKVVGPEDGLTPNSRWANTNEMAADPTDPNRLLVASDDGLVEMLYDPSADDSVTINEIFTPDQPGRICVDVDITSDGQTVLAVFRNNSGSVHYVFRNQNGASKNASEWENVSENGITQSNNRIEAAIAPSDGNFMYAGVADRRNRLEGFYQSKDGGDTWTKLISGNPQTFYPFSNFGLTIGGQGDYDNAVVVDPLNPERVFLGGVHTWRWSQENGWFRIAGTNRFENDGTRNPFFVHADKHNFVFDTATDPYRLYLLNDGGIEVSDDAQGNPKPTFSTFNRGYSTVQFYNVASSVRPPYKATGGAQDNGTHRLEPSSLTGKSSVEIFGGDGFSCEVSRLAEQEVWFYGSQFGEIRRSFDEGQSDREFTDENIKPEGRDNIGPFNTTFRLWEGIDTVEVDKYIYDPENPDNSRIVKVQETNYNSLFAIGTYEGIWITRDATNEQVTPTWFNVAPNVFSGGFQEVTDFAFSDDGDVLYISGRNRTSGEVWRISGLRDARLKYDVNPATGVSRFNRSESGIEVRRIHGRSSQVATGITVDPNNKDRVIATYGNYATPDHVYLSTNATAANPDFESIQGEGEGRLPEFPVYDAAISLRNADHIFVVTEFGVYGTLDGGTTWQEMNNGMERVATYEIRQYEHFTNNGQRREGPHFVIGTHGRGIFRASNRSVVTSVLDEPTAEAAGDQLQLSLYPNPVQDRLSVALGRSVTDATLRIYDASGRQVMMRKADTGARTEFSVADLQPGNYILRAEAPEGTQTAQFVKR